ncbi:TetR/AcrR family transcriptional regulator [Cohnella cholangitidis]|uniref:TetR/AcrR family transcriptional regulator n=1 Tax=Cohnella cholangitidis TaxID=2598458 RepID=A0A7G5BYT5_9BACL|nr:TetR/AcrR family transcriptional regulator [Cohnella cholangitidis]QMV42119.1 TetR/AcrR family transcriptional regulator [Cohnella cholangitidis]
MSDKIDRRKARTKQLLYDALMELVKEKGAESVTVTDITNRADINRGTFYLHYRDVADMLEQLKEEAFEMIGSRVRQLDIMEYAECARRDEPYPKMIEIFEEFTRNAHFFQVMFGPKGDPAYMNQYKELMTNHIFSRMSYHRPNSEGLLVPMDYLIAYISSANLGIVLHWMQTGMNQTPAELGIILTRIFNHGPSAAAGFKSIPPHS